MSFANDILDAIEIMVKQVVEDNATKIYTGVCKTIGTGNCVLTINGKDNTVKYYGGVPVVGTVYQVFIPFGNMSAAFIIVPGSGGESGGSGVDSVNGMTGDVVLNAADVGLGNVDNIKQYSASNPPPYPVVSVNGKTGGVNLIASDVGAAPAGYGYGEQIQIMYWSDSDGSQLGAYLDNYIANKFPNDKSGVFRISNFVDYPACLVSGNGGYADVYFNKNADDYSEFTVIVSFTGPVDVLDDASGCAYQAVLKRTWGGWKQWEYVNPPMELGKEYRTTEQYLGKPVYMAAFNAGPCTNGITAYFGENVTGVVGGTVLTGSYSNVYPLYNGFTDNTWTYKADVFWDSAGKRVAVTFYTGSSASGSYSANTAIVKYLKD